MKNKLTASLIVGGVFTVILTMIALTLPTSATGSVSVLQKAALSGLYDCYHSGAYKDSINFADYNGDLQLSITQTLAKFIYQMGQRLLKMVLLTVVRS